MDQIWFAEKNVTLITTDLKGTDVADIYADFKFSEDGKEIISCPAGHRPKSNVYDINTQKCKASFPILESYGYEMNAPRSGSSHYTYVDAWYFWRKELEIDLSGFKKEEVRAELKDGYLTVSAVKDLDEDEKDKETGKYIRRERYHQYWHFILKY